jgi:hypothetical protein
MDDEVTEYLEKHYICNDRFTFDAMFKFLLSKDISPEEAKDLILYNCSLSLIVLQERIHNNYYEKIEVDDEISDDLKEWTDEIYREILKKKIEDKMNETN